MIPFTQPYTEPGGIARRPLAERVPECVPRLACDPAPMPNPPPNRKPGWCYADDSMMPAEAYSALWRVAVEDWIRYSEGVCGINICDEDGVDILFLDHEKPRILESSYPGSVSLSLEEREGNEWWVMTAHWQQDDCFDLMKSLNLAAHVLADAMGLTP